MSRASCILGCIKFFVFSFAFIPGLIFSSSCDDSYSLSKHHEVIKKIRTTNYPGNAIDFQNLSFSELTQFFEREFLLARQKYKEIATNPDKPTFKNTILELESYSENIEIVTGIAHLYYRTARTTESDKFFNYYRKRMATLSSGERIGHEKKIFKRVEEIYNSRFEQRRPYSPQKIKLIEDYYEYYRSAEINLTKSVRDEVNFIGSELSFLSERFNTNLKDQKQLTWLTFSLEALEGVNQEIVESMKVVSNGQVYYQTSLAGGLIQEILATAANEQIRKEIYEVLGQIGSYGRFDNSEIIKDMAYLRARYAELHGYESYADFVLKERMAENVKNVQDFLNKIERAARPVVAKDTRTLQKFYEEYTGKKDQIKPWDRAYFSRLYDEMEFDFNYRDLVPYLEVENVITKVHGLVQTLYGVKLIPRDLPVHHPDIKTYVVFDKKQNKEIGLLYLDLYSRPNKNGGAWMNPILKGYSNSTGSRLPHILNALNIRKSAEGKLTFLSLGDVQTMLHELGHGLHGLLSKTKYKTHAGISVKWDWVELPSTLLEIFATDRLFLEGLGQHYETGAPFPKDLLDRLEIAVTHGRANGVYNTMWISRLDLAWHTPGFEDINDIMAFENQFFQRSAEEIKHRRGQISNQMTHLFSGGYAAGYYSYLWSRALAMDIYSVFKEKGLYNREVAERFRKHILEVGGSVDPNEAFYNFAGRKPNWDAILKF